MADEMDDDELQQLLEQLDTKEDFVAEAIEADAETVEESETAEKTAEEKSDIPTEFTPEVTLRSAEDLVPEDARRFDGDARDLATVEEVAVPAVNLELQKYMDRLDDVTNEVLSACRSDRQEAQDVIDIYKKSVQDAVTANKPPARMWVDGLVKAVEVKAGINGNAVKVIEANAKMLAATKAGSMINQQINVGGGENLDEVLSQGLTEDDEY